VLTAAEEMDRVMIVMAVGRGVLNWWRVIRSAGRAGEVKGGPMGKIPYNMNVFYLYSIELNLRVLIALTT
jgi:hypothetical protein